MSSELNLLDNKKIVWAPMPGSQVAVLTCPIFELLYCGTRGNGKRISDKNQILTDSGWKYVGEVTTADKLVAPDGSYTSIDGIFPQKNGELYRVTFDDGVTLDVDLEHRWYVRNSKNYNREGWKIVTTQELLTNLERVRGQKYRNRWYIPTPAAAPGRSYSGLDPYICGLMLGDGTTRSQYVCIYSQDEEILNYVRDTQGWTRYKYQGQVERVSASSPDLSNPWKEFLGEHKGSDKRVPQCLLESDPSTRLAVLQGLMDSDGCADKDGRVEFASISHHLAKQVQYLARSLGGKARIHWQNIDPKKGGQPGYYRVKITHCNKFNPFRLTRKASRVKHQQGANREILSIIRIDDGPATCFAVSHPSHQFVCQGFVVTHNTDTLIMDFAKDVGKGYGADWRGILFRRTYPELADVIDKTKKWFPLIWPNNARYNETKSFWHWKTGEKLLLRPFEQDSDYWSYHGHAYPWIGWEELTTHPTSNGYLKLFSCCRSSNPKVAKISRVRSTTNPGSSGHNWVKTRFKLPHHAGRIIRGEVDSSGNPEPDRIAISGRLTENRALMEADPGYLNRIIASATTEAELRAWRDGDWDIVSGGMFDDLWERKYHVVDPFNIPHSWQIVRAFDWGSSEPFALVWFAISDGSDVTMANGQVKSTVRGDHFYFMEFYGWNGKPNQGSKMLATEIAEEAVIRELRAGIYNRVQPGYADHAIFKTENGMNIALDMAKPVRLEDGREYRGITFLPADKSSGSRELGWEVIRKMLGAAKPQKYGPREKPGVYFFSNCEHILRTLPVAGRNPLKTNDLDKHFEDHCLDVLRYQCRGVGTAASYGLVTGLT